MNFVNLTPHAISIVNNEITTTFEPSGDVARVTSTAEPIGSIGGFEVARNSYGKVQDLPSPKEGITYIVSGMVLSQCQNRSDVVAPRTDGTAIRNDKGHIVAVRGFVAP